MLSKAQKCQALLRTEYEELDRELYEANSGITIIKTKKKRVKRVEKVASEIFTSYENMSLRDRENALARLIEIQENMSQKTQT